MTEPAVSVVIPAYNRTDLLGETLRTAFAQTYTDMEVIVADDGSTDGTPEMVARDFPRVRLIRGPHTGLPAVGRNAGIRESRGRYIAFLDHDDLWHPEKLRIQMAYLQAHPEYRWVYSDAESFSSSSPRRRRLIGRFLGRQGRVFDALLRRNFIPQMTVVAERACLEEAGLFDEDPEIRTSEDWHMWLRLAARWPVGYIPRVLAYYRIHEGGALLSAWKVHMRAVLRVTEKVGMEFGRTPEQVKKLQGHWYFHHYRHVLRYAPESRGELLSRALRLRFHIFPALFWLAEWLGELPLARLLADTGRRLLR